MRGEGFVISQNQSLQSGVGIGDQLVLETPNGPLSRPVVGIVEFYYVEKGTVFMDRKLFKQYWGDNSVDLILLYLQPGIDRSSFKAEINRAMAGEQRAFIYTNEEYKAWSSRLTDQFFTLTYLEMLIAIFVATMGLINMLVVSVSDRQRGWACARSVACAAGFAVLLEALPFPGRLRNRVIAGLFNATFWFDRSQNHASLVSFSVSLSVVLITLPIINRGPACCLVDTNRAVIAGSGSNRIR